MVSLLCGATFLVHGKHSRRKNMALRVINVLNRMSVLRGQYSKQLVKIPSALASWKPPTKEPEDLPESIDAPLYTDHLPDTILQNRIKHLPERGEETPFKDKQRKCVLCFHNIEPDYKNIRLLSQFVSGFSGVIYDRHITGLCQKRQQQIEREIIKSRRAGLMPWTYKVNKYQNDPQLFNPAKPVRPHPYW